MNFIAVLFGGTSGNRGTARHPVRPAAVTAQTASRAASCRPLTLSCVGTRNGGGPCHCPVSAPGMEAVPDTVLCRHQEWRRSLTLSCVGARSGHSVEAGPGPDGAREERDQMSRVLHQRRLPSAIGDSSGTKRPRRRAVSARRQRRSSGLAGRPLPPSCCRPFTVRYGSKRPDAVPTRRLSVHSQKPPAYPASSQSGRRPAVGQGSKSAGISLSDIRQGGEEKARGRRGRRGKSGSCRRERVGPAPVDRSQQSAGNNRPSTGLTR